MQYKNINVNNKNELIELFNSSKDIIDNHFYNDGLYRRHFFLLISDILDKELVNTKNFDYFIEKILDVSKKFSSEIDYATSYSIILYIDGIYTIMEKLIKMIDEINNENLINILFNYQLELDKRKEQENRIRILIN